MPCHVIINKSPKRFSSGNLSLAANRANRACPPYCISCIRGRCLWPCGDCRSRPVCNSCDGGHSAVRCLFQSSSTSRLSSPSPTRCARANCFTGLERPRRFGVSLRTDSRRARLFRFTNYSVSRLTNVFSTSPGACQLV